jgi:hypothetical protein
MLARACLRLCSSAYDPDRLPRPLSSPIPDAAWRGSQIPSLASQQQDGRWALDESSASCNRCAGVFSAMQRRHHCRWCGCLVCGSCSQTKRQLPPADFGGLHAEYKAPQSVCAVCSERLSNGAQQAAAYAQA